MVIIYFHDTLYLLNKLVKCLYLFILSSDGLHSFFFRSIALFLEDARIAGVSQSSRLINFLFIYLINRRGNARSKVALYNVMKSLNDHSGKMLIKYYDNQSDLSNF